MPRKFTEDFKQTIVDLYKSGKSAKELSREYGIAIPNIYLWINKNKGIISNDSDEVITLKKEILKLKEENEILKKATAIFAKKI